MDQGVVLIFRNFAFAPPCSFFFYKPFTSFDTFDPFVTFDSFDLFDLFDLPSLQVFHSQNMFLK